MSTYEDAVEQIFELYKPKKRKSGTGCVDHLFEGRYSPRNAYGKRESHNIYAKTREEKLAEMTAQVKARIQAEKERLKQMNEVLEECMSNHGELYIMSTNKIRIGNEPAKLFN